MGQVILRAGDKRDSLLTRLVGCRCKVLEGDSWVDATLGRVLVISDNPYFVFFEDGRVGFRDTIKVDTNLLNKFEAGYFTGHWEEAEDFLSQVVFQSYVNMKRDGNRFLDFDGVSVFGDIPGLIKLLRNSNFTKITISSFYASAGMINTFVENRCILDGITTINSNGKKVPAFLIQL